MQKFKFHSIQNYANVCKSIQMYTKVGKDTKDYKETKSS